MARPSGQRVIAAKRRPPTSEGSAFYGLEDRTARVQAIVSPDLWEAHRVLFRDARALIMQGQVTRWGRAVTVQVQRLSHLLLWRAESPREAADQACSSPGEPLPCALCGLAGSGIVVRDRSLPAFWRR